jgi:hypothetical protein
MAVDKSRFVRASLRLCTYLLAFALSGCSTVSDLKNYDAPLPQGKGVLLVSVQTDLPIKTLHLIDTNTGADDAAMNDIPAGYTVRAVLVKTGDYEWLRADYPDNLTMQGVENHWIMLNEHAHLRFSVKPGVVNYPGDLVIQQSAANQMSIVVPQPNELGAYKVPQLAYHFGLINRVSQAEAAADDRTQTMIKRLGLVYTGPETDMRQASQQAHSASIDSSVPKADCEKLMNATLPFAEQMLKEHGEFYPYGSALDPAGKVLAVAVSGPNEMPRSAEVIDDLNKSMMEGALTGEYMATAIVYDARVTLPADERQSDAIVIRLDHRDHYSVKVFLPYHFAGTELILDTAFAEKGEANIFPSD